MSDNNRRSRPPVIAAWMLNWLVADHFNTHAGDFEEFYHAVVEEKGRSRANWWYRGQVLRLIPDQLFEKAYWGLLMFKSYLLVGGRNLRKSKVASSINIVGLAAAIGSAIAIFLFVYGLNTADRFHQNLDNVYLIGHTTDDIEALPGMRQKWGTSPVPMGPALEGAYPQIEGTVRYSRQAVSVRAERIAFRERASFADPEFLEMFTFPLVSGDPSALDQPSSVIISDAMATKYFGLEDALDRELVIRFANGREEMFVVGGVAEAFPIGANFTFDFLFGYEKLLDAGLQSLDDWEAKTWTFVDFRDENDVAYVESQLDAMIRPQTAGLDSEQIQSYFLDSVRNPNWLTAFLIKDRAIMAPRIIETAMFSILGALMLLISCFNYITIALGSAARRLREIGVRKSTGAMKKQLVQQFLTENLLICFFALCAGILIAWTITIPFMNGMVHHNLEIQPGYFGLGAFWLFLIGLLVVVGVISGAYPAFYVSSFQPVEILRGSRKLGEKKALTRVLTTVQFVLTIVTICFATFAWSIDDRLTAVDWGYEPDQLVVLPVINAEHYAQLSDGVSQLANVEAVAGARDHVGADRRRISIWIDGEEKKSYFYGIGPGYLETMGLYPRQGRGFPEEFAADDSSSIVVNQSFAAAMDWEDPLDQAVRIEDHTYTVVGVVDDFMLSPYTSTSEPVIFAVVPAASFTSLAVRADSDMLAPVVASMQEVWRSKFPEVTFAHYPQSEVFEAQSMKGLSVFMGYVALFALLISCMGLFGMASQRAANRMKEIGIRKSMGATASHLLLVANREFLVMLGIATAIATPLSYFTFANTLMRYASIDVSHSIAPYVLANILVFAVAILSLSLQSRKLLKVVPAVVLRVD